MAKVTKKSEMKKFRTIFSDIDDEQKKVVERLIENAAFMAVELSKLQEYIELNGCTETYQNGANQFGKKKSSEVEVYNTMIKNYASIIKQLCDLKPVKNNSSDELLQFITR